MGQEPKLNVVETDDGNLEELGAMMDSANFNLKRFRETDHVEDISEVLRDLHRAKELAEKIFKNKNQK